MCTLCQAMNPSLGLQTHTEWSEPDFSNASSSPTIVSPLSATFNEGADAAANSSTSYVLGDDDVFSGSVDFIGDEDWIAITLVNGAHLTVVQDNISLGNTNTLLSLVDSCGNLLFGTAGNTELYFDADESTVQYYNDTGSTQTVYVVASSFSGGTGDYTVTAQIQEYGQGTYAEIVEYLTTGWIGTQMAFDVGPGDTINYDISDLDADEQVLALTAMEAWTFVTGINFAAGAGGITFVNHLVDGNGDEIAGSSSTQNAFAGPSNLINNVIGSASVTVTSGWVDNYGADLDDYSFQTYMHEIGHAMGLVHGGPYNGSANYSTVPGGDNIFTNDSTQYTIMSYFDPYEVAGGSFVPYDLLTPMMADILAMQELYGIAGNIRSGDTVYGDGSTAGGYYDLLTGIGPYAAFTLIDDGGIDTLNFASATVGLTLDLAPGAFSSVGLGTDNFAIFETTVLENFIGGSGADFISGNAAENSFSGGSGDDTLFGFAGNDIIDGGLNNDSLEGGSGLDTIVGGSGNDTISGGDDADSINGNSGVDTIYGDSGDDSLRGSFGADSLFGGDDDDFIFGDGGNDYLSGGSGFDTLDGGSGSDSLFGASGDDSLFGAAGNDDLSGETGFDTIDGGAGADTIYGGAGEDNLIGNGRSDRIYGGEDNDSIFGDGAIDTLYGDGGNDIISGGAQRDLIYGGLNDDVISGGFGNDTIFGGDGADEIVGDGGNDRIDGGAGNDTISGGSGADTFIFEVTGGVTNAIGNNEILDFQNNVDTIQLSSALWGGGLTIQGVLDTYATETGTDVIFDFGSGNQITVFGVVNEDVLLDDITFI